MFIENDWEFFNLSITRSIIINENIQMIELWYNNWQVIKLYLNNKEREKTVLPKVIKYING